MIVCVNCGREQVDGEGRPASHAYDTQLANKSGIIKLSECKLCLENVDKYIEYEGCLVLLDLALQHQPAYRHVLINQNRRTAILKMVFLTLVVDGYCRWHNETGGGQFFERELEFYVKFGLALASLAVFLATCLILTAAGHSLKARANGPRYHLLLTGLLLSYCARFLQLGALLWGSHSTSNAGLESTKFMWVFVDLLYFLTTRNVVKTLGGFAAPQSTIVAVVSHAAFHLFEMVTG